MIYNTFETRIYQSFIDIDEESIKNELKENFFENYEYVKTSFWKIKHILSEPNLEFLNKAAREFFQEVGSSEKYSIFEIMNSWIQIYDKGHFHDTHSHFMDKDNWNFVFFLNADDDSSKLVILEPGYPYINNNKRVYIKPKTGLCVAFPGYLPHFVEPNKSENRIILSANVQYNQGARA